MLLTDVVAQSSLTAILSHNVKVHGVNENLFNTNDIFVIFALLKNSQLCLNELELLAVVAVVVHELVRYDFNGHHAIHWMGSLVNHR